LCHPSPRSGASLRAPVCLNRRGAPRLRAARPASGSLRCAVRRALRAVLSGALRARLAALALLGFAQGTSSSAAQLLRRNATHLLVRGTPLRFVPLCALRARGLRPATCRGCSYLAPLP